MDQPMTMPATCLVGSTTLRNGRLEILGTKTTETKRTETKRKNRGQCREQPGPAVSVFTPRHRRYVSSIWSSDLA